MINRTIQEAEVHLQLIDVVRGRRVTAAAPFAPHTVLITDISAIPEHGGVLDVDAGSRLSLKDLPALWKSLAWFFRTPAILNCNGDSTDWSYPAVGIKDGIVHIYHIDVEVGRNWLQHGHKSSDCKGGKSHFDIGSIVERRIFGQQRLMMFSLPTTTT